MKNKLLLLVVPTFLLSSCSLLLGPEISEEKAEPIMKQIHDKNEELDGSIDLQISLNASSGKGEEKAKQESKMRLKIAANEDIYYYQKEKTSNKKGVNEEVFEYYQVNDEKYEEITYLAYYKESEEKVVHETYLKKDNPNYETVTSDIINGRPIGALFIGAVFADPTAINTDEAIGEGMICTKKYHSWGSKNLSIEIKGKRPGAIDDSEEVTTEANISITYDNLLLKEVTASSKSNYGNKSSLEIKASLDGNLVVNLPSDWKENIVSTSEPAGEE